MEKVKYVKVNYFYYKTLRQNSIEFLTSISSLDDKAIDYKVTVEEYFDINVLKDVSIILTDDILTVIAFADMYINKFLRGIV